MKRILATVLLLILIPLCALAHPGSLDENGGHFDRSTGEYHYHEGIHTNGTSYGYSYVTNPPVKTARPSTTVEPQNKQWTFGTVVLAILCVPLIFAMPFALVYVGGLFVWMVSAFVGLFTRRK